MSALKPIIYFSLFGHPLTQEEVIKYSDHKDIDSIHKDLELLISKGVIDKVDNFLLYENDKSHIQKRITGKINANAVMPKALKRAKHVSSFPFVKAVGISGSLSKGYFDNDSDFDFFVITKARRVWITRTFIALYKRMFLLNSHKEFCVNYFISTETLEIEEKNRFTATEIATVIPIYGKTEFKDFYKKNEWVYRYFPHINFNQKQDKIFALGKIKRKIFLEFIFDNYLGQIVNYICMRIITLKWEKKYKSRKNEVYKSKKEISKHHPDNFQFKVISNLNNKYRSCEQLHGIHIPEEHV